MLDTIEIDRGGASYTVDTLRALHARGETDLHLIVGTDMLLSFDKIWRAPDEIARLAALPSVPAKTRTGTRCVKRRRRSRTRSVQP